MHICAMAPSSYPRANQRAFCKQIKMESKEEENSRRVHRKLNDFAHQLEVLDRMAQTNMTNLNRRQKEFERNQHNDERLLQTLNLGMSQLDHKASTNS